MIGNQILRFFITISENRLDSALVLFFHRNGRLILKMRKLSYWICETSQFSLD